MTEGTPDGPTTTVRTIEYGGRKVGRVDGLTYFTYRKPSHFVRRFNGWGVQLDLWNELRRAGILQIVVEFGAGRLYSRMQDWEKFGQVATLNPNDGEQIFLERSYFIEENQWK